MTRAYDLITPLGVSATFSLREFSLVLRDDIYLRFQSFKNAEEMREEVLRLCPDKMDIGAVYTAKVRAWVAPRDSLTGNW
jgi:DNA primase catalytic subunit